jgi:FMN-dependent NADH-azoreductase
MWNSNIPWVLKHYIDTITQPGLTFCKHKKQTCQFCMFASFHQMAIEKDRNGKYQIN